MAKRFTATEKWNDPWFRGLPPHLKLGWFYLCDNCDPCGVIDLDAGLANFQICAEIDWNELFRVTAGRVEKLPNGKLWLTKFVRYQYGKLSGDCKPHVPVINLLRRHGINVEDVDQNDVFHHGSVSSAKRRQILERDEYICCYCGYEFDKEFLVIDHVHPRSKGGDHANSNLVVACVECNLAKADSDVDDFINSLSSQKAARQRLSERVCNTLKEKEQDKEQDKDKASKGDARGKQPRVTADMVPVPDGWNTVDVLAAIQDWLSYKVKRGEAYRDPAYLGRKVAEFQAAGPAAFIAAVNSSIGSNYSGLFPTKGTNDKSTPRVGPGQRFQG